MNDDLNKNGVRKEEQTSSELLINQQIKTTDQSFKQKYFDIQQNLIDRDATGIIQGNLLNSQMNGTGI